MGLIINGISFLNSVFTTTDTVMPTFNFELGLFKLEDSLIFKIIGTLWTTFTQFPEAFWAGKIANSEPVAGLKLSISVLNFKFGKSLGRIRLFVQFSN